MFFLGVDQGSTKTLAIVIRHDGAILGKGLGFGACHFFDGMPKAMAAVQQAANEALSQAGISSLDLNAISAGMAGANFPEEFAALETGLSDLFHTKDVVVYNDCLPALRAGTANPFSGVISAGTGLNVALRGPSGVLIVYNNYIEELDQGAGALGRRMLHAVFQSEIGILPSTGLTQRVLGYFGMRNVLDLLLAYQRHQLTQPVKDLCPLLFEVASKADSVALDIIANFGISVSRYILAGIRRFKLQDQSLDLVLSGGVFKSRSPLLVETISREILQIAPGARVIPAQFEPVVGAALFTLDHYYKGVLTGSVLGSCRSTAEKHGLLQFPVAEIA